jgi:hypothetical protein
MTERRFPAPWTAEVTPNLLATTAGPVSVVGRTSRGKSAFLRPRGWDGKLDHQVEPDGARKRRTAAHCRARGKAGSSFVLADMGRGESDAGATDEAWPALATAAPSIVTVIASGEGSRDSAERGLREISGRGRRGEAISSPRPGPAVVPCDAGPALCWGKRYLIVLGPTATRFGGFMVPFRRMCLISSAA